MLISALNLKVQNIRFWFFQNINKLILVLRNVFSALVMFMKSTSTLPTLSHLTSMYDINTQLFTFSKSCLRSLCCSGTTLMVVAIFVNVSIPA
jgi:hypothetical protein